ncbi:hypothetical protein FACS189449_02300 [Alphaproteobacteria bacterium]|nr:hypothetical protein FACS189449_02300 [Alphaproteobacteria bacterium]
MRRRRRRIKFISIVFALLAVGIIAFVLAYVLDTKNSDCDTFQFANSSAESVLSDVTYKTYDAGGKEITLSSKRITEEKKDNYILEKMISDFQLSDGERGNISSNTTKVIKDDKTICEFSGNVKFTTSSGLEMTTEKSIVDFNQKTAVGNTDLLMEKDGLRLSSNNYHFDLDNNVATLIGNAKGFSNENTIYSDKMVIRFFSKKETGNLSNTKPEKSIKSVDAIGHVKCTSADYILTAQKNILYTPQSVVADSNVVLVYKSDGSTVYCDKMVIVLESDNLSDAKSIKSVDAIGHARCTSTDYILTAQKNIMYTSQSIIADSNVTLIYKKDEKTFDIRSGHMVATLDGNGRIKEVNATNSLTIKTADATIHSNRGVLRDNKVTAFGNVVISRPDGDVFGETAVFDVNTGNISIDKSSGIVTDGKEVKK